jgi:hypothetical protein
MPVPNCWTLCKTNNMAEGNAKAMAITTTVKSV